MANLGAVALLGALGLLLAPAGASPGTQQGEVCRAWTYAPFQCPKRPDGADGRFCCGPCHSPYCCAVERARLDQTQCLRALRRLEAPPLTKDAGKEGTTGPAGQELKTVTRVPDSPEATSLQPPPGLGAVTTTGTDARRGDSPTATPRTLPSRHKPSRGMPGILWVVFGMLAALFLFYAFCRFCPCPPEYFGRACYPCLDTPNPSPPDSVVRPPTCSSVEYHVRPPSPVSINLDLDPPPSYEEAVKLPPFSPLNPFNPLSDSPPQDRTAVMELSVRNLGYQASGASSGSLGTLVGSTASDPTRESSDVMELGVLNRGYQADEATSGSLVTCPDLIASGPTGESSGTGEVAAQLEPSGTGEVVIQLEPSDAGEVAARLVPPGSREAVDWPGPSGAGKGAAKLVPSHVGKAAAWLVPPDAGKVAAQVLPSSTGEVAARLVSAAQHVVIPPPEPTKKRRRPGAYWESKESEL